MLVASSKTQERNLAWLTHKSQGPFFCLGCKAEVILKKGEVREHHFAHKPPVDCIDGSAESQLHLRAKREIYSALVNHPYCSKCELEHRLKKTVPDISLYINEKPVAIEIQRTTIDIDDILRRTAEYAKLGIYLLWIIPLKEPEAKWHEGEEAFVYRIKEWERYLHAMYYGRLYFWQEEAFVIPYHFGAFEIRVEESQWYDEYGQEQYAEGYSYTAKSLKLPIRYPERKLHIAEDFGAEERKRPFNTEKWSIPICKLWKDNLSKWW